MGSRTRTATTTTELRRLRQMAALGTVSADEADRALGRPRGFARWWGRKLGLTFARGHVGLLKRMMLHRGG